jgi:hypothetical protein
MQNYGEAILKTGKNVGGFQRFLKEIGSEDLRWIKCAQGRVQLGIALLVPTVSATKLLVKCAMLLYYISYNGGGM